MATKSTSVVSKSSAKSAIQDGAITSKRTPRTLAGTPSGDLAARKSVLTHYESAIKLLQAGKYDKAHTAFTAMLESAPDDFADRIRMYIAACVGQIDKGQASFQSHEERYDYAISLLNQGHYEDAREHFMTILLKAKDADYAFYGLALLASMTGDTPKCIEHLTEAIRLNSQNRFQARSDSDFESVADDPSFTELLYPEA
jgi:tetratricopeptide (TPR) repeat protein